MNHFTNMSRRRKADHDEVLIYHQPHKKAPRIEIDEKDLIAEGMDYQHLAHTGSQRTSFPQNTVMQHPHSVLAGQCVEDMMEFATAPFAQNSVAQLRGFEQENQFNRHHAGELQQAVPVSQQSQQPSLQSGACVQCLSGESGHIHHILNRMQRAGNP